MGANKRKSKPPTSFITVIGVTLFTVLLWPLIIYNAGSSFKENEHWGLIAFFPIYAILSAYLAYRTHNERRGIAWILIILVWLAFASVLLLV